MRTLRLVARVTLVGASACGGGVFTAGGSPTDGGDAEGGLVDTSVSDAPSEGTAPDVSSSDAVTPDAGGPDAGGPDGGALDAGPPDVNSPDAWTVPDEGSPDAIGAADAPGDGAPADAPHPPPPDAGDVARCLTGGNVLYLDGDSTDYIHPGMATITAATWSPTFSPSGAPSTVSIHLVPTSSSQGLWWDADFSSAMLGQPLTLQTYTGAQRLPFAASGAPGLEVTGDGRGCNTLVGTFTIRDLQVSGASLVSFTASFVQHCEGGGAALRGCVHVGN